jgi:hypothetical protein
VAGVVAAGAAGAAAPPATFTADGEFEDSFPAVYRRISMHELLAY